MDGIRKAIAIDFDGCLCTDAFPAIGDPNWPVINRAKAEQQAGAGLILWTCREDQLLLDAIAACEGWGLTFDSMNESLPDWIEAFKTQPRKVGASEYWDDKAVQMPVFNPSISDLRLALINSVYACVLKKGYSKEVFVSIKESLNNTFERFSSIMRLLMLPDTKYTDADGEEALRKAMWTCGNTNNPVTRYAADAIVEKLCRDTEKGKPLTLEELRGMDGEPVWIVPMRGSGGFCTWMLVDAEYELCREAHGEMAVFENCGKTWLAYRRKPEEG